MNEITLTINGKQVKGKEGDTVLEVCETNGIYVPTLCHYKGLIDVGACRLCVVDIEKERRPVPACTYPARDGLVVQTHNERLERYRRLALELLFTERNHLCAQCVASGDCELQNLAYQYQMDNFRYSLSWPSVPVDSVNDYLIIDHNRCILCGRCIRVCDEITGIHTLDFGNRGWKDMIVADLNQPLGKSSCISCGACFQVCPTGAIFAKLSAYKGKPSECDQVNSVCPVCGVGCEIKALVKDNRLVRIDSPDLTSNRGLLCHKGRFLSLQQRKDRIETPLVRNNKGELEPCSLNEAANAIAKKFSELKTRYGGNSIAGIASSQISNESLKAFKEFMAETAGSQLIDTFDGDDYRAITKGISNFQNKAGLNIETPIEEILKSDCILVVGANPLESHPVIGSYIVRAASQSKAKLIVLDSIQNTFSFYTSVWLKPKEGKETTVINLLIKAILDKSLFKDSAQAKRIAASLKDTELPSSKNETGIDADELIKAAEILGKSKHSIIICGEKVLQYKNPKLITSLLNLSAISESRNGGRPRIISLKAKGNSWGAWNLGIANSTESVLNSLSNGVKALYLLLSDDSVEKSKLIDAIKGIEFIVVQSAYSSPLASIANVVLPSPIWTEVGGNYYTLDGILKHASRLIRPPEGVRADWETINEISRRFRK